MKNILVTGGAGYIGSHVCKLLSRHGFTPITLDTLETGHRGAVLWGPLIKGSIEDGQILDDIFSTYNISSVMHFAAYCYVGESFNSPAKYFTNNVCQTIFLLNHLVKYNIKNFIFSSSCATYGEPEFLPITETHPQSPINPYGRTKYIIEQTLQDYANAYGLKYVSLRYFNAAGADPEGIIGEDHRPETHIIPRVLKSSLDPSQIITVFGNTYDTADGTCIRDYIHVEDLALAHLLAQQYLFENGDSAHFNLGNERGFSVQEILETAQRITGIPVQFKMGAKRQGDPAILVGSAMKAKSELNWKPSYASIDDIISTAWNWLSSNPSGYRE